MNAGKIAQLRDVVSRVADGSHVALGGFAIARNPIAVAHELIRQGKKHLTVSQCIAGMDTDLLVGAGAVRELVYGGGSLDRFGPVHNVNRAIASESIIAKEYSGLAMAMRFTAGSLGLPFIPIRSLMGSDLLDGLLRQRDVMVQDDPFSGERVVLLKPLEPDFCFIHVPLADVDGNTWISGPRWDQEAAMSADHLIVAADRIAAQGYAERHSDTVVIPGCRVEAVVHVPFGAHPTGVHGCYDYDAEHLRFYESQAKDLRLFEKYVSEFILGTREHCEYLELVGGVRLAANLAAEPLCGYSAAFGKGG
ncbi:MAG: CoA transferase subunit A [Firmicutes bacterium]|nr:CoA transferase subunit A [Bacillota bacterium]